MGSFFCCCSIEEKPSAVSQQPSAISRTLIQGLWGEREKKIGAI
jgi:hypothetical protein